MSRAAWSGWAHQLLDSLCDGLCRTGAFLVMQHGFAMTAPQEAPASAHANSGV
jgi:hypothetical protein